MFKSNSIAKNVVSLFAAVVFGSTLLTVAPSALAEKMEGPVIYSDVTNNISVDGAITAGNGMDGTAQNNVGVIAGKVRTHARVTNNIKIRGAVTAGNGMNGNAQNNIGVITDQSVGASGGSGGGGLLDTIGGFITGLF